VANGILAVVEGAVVNIEKLDRFTPLKWRRLEKPDWIYTWLLNEFRYYLLTAHTGIKKLTKKERRERVSSLWLKPRAFARKIW